MHLDAVALQYVALSLDGRTVWAPGRRMRERGGGALRGRAYLGDFAPAAAADGVSAVGGGPMRGYSLQFPTGQRAL